MWLTAGLPWRHPAVVLGATLFALSVAAIAYEEHLQSIGSLPDQGPARLIMSLAGSAFWAWCTVKMVGEPDAFLGSTNLVDAERHRRRAALLSQLGYALQVLSIVGILVLLVKLKS